MANCEGQDYARQYGRLAHNKLFTGELSAAREDIFSCRVTPVSLTCLSRTAVHVRLYFLEKCQMWAGPDEDRK